jgi:hypothetical protein
VGVSAAWLAPASVVHDAMIQLPMMIPRHSGSRHTAITLVLLGTRTVSIVSVARFPATAAGFADIAIMGSRDEDEQAFRPAVRDTPVPIGISGSHGTIREKRRKTLRL